jgi:MinD superfamily P-loop ATPase
MKQLVLLSGKGGTGKTTVAAALAHLASQELPLVMADADVDAANLELLLSPTRKEDNLFMSGQFAVIDEELCAGCGACESVCRFDAVEPPQRGEIAYRVDPTACEGCASCLYQCPTEAIRTEDRRSGMWFRSETRFGPLVHAHLFAAQENSGKLVTLVKQQAIGIAKRDGYELILVDGPPGIGCPVISALSGADAALLVCEPTVSGLHDLQRVLATTRHFHVPASVVINKCDLNQEMSSAIEEICRAQQIPVVGWIPYDSVVTEAVVNGQPLTVYTDGPVANALQEVWKKTQEQLFRPETISV